MSNAFVVRVAWGETTLRVWHLVPPRRFSIGDDPATSDFVVPAELVGPERRIEIDPSALTFGVRTRREIGTLNFELTIEPAAPQWAELRKPTDPGFWVTVAVAAIAYGALLFASTLDQKRDEEKEYVAQAMLMFEYLVHAEERAEQREVARLQSLPAAERERERGECEARCEVAPRSVTNEGEYSRWRRQCRPEQSWVNDADAGAFERVRARFRTPPLRCDLLDAPKRFYDHGPIGSVIGLLSLYPRFWVEDASLEVACAEMGFGPYSQTLRPLDAGGARSETNPPPPPSAAFEEIIKAAERGEIAYDGPLGAPPPQAPITSLHGGQSSDGAPVRPHGLPEVRTPQLLLSTPMVVGKLPTQAIQLVVRQNFFQIRRCYEDGLRNQPSLEGHTSVKFTIDSHGAVVGAATAGGGFADHGVVACVVSEFARLTFPQPAGGTVTVVFPLAFSPG